MVSQAQPTSNLESRRRLIYTAISLVLLVAVYFGFYKITGFAMPCVFHEVTGWYCPGCGISRMLLAILSGDFYQAFRYNPLLFILLPFAAIFFANWAYAKYNGKTSWCEKIPEWVWVALAIIIVIYGVLRNLPTFDYLAPTCIG